MIEILTDSTCDLPAELIKPYPIQVLPFLVMWDGRTYRDRVDLTPADFYARLRASSRLPTTGLAGPEQFAGAFRSACERGASAVVVITIASQLSGAAGMALQASAGSPIPVHIHESGGTTMGMGWQVLAAARTSAAGGSLADVLAEAERVRRRVRVYALLDTLEFAFRGGRLSRISYMVGSALNFKGLISIEHDCGSVRVIGRARGKSRAVEMLYERFFDSADMQHIAVLHGDAESDARELYEQVRIQHNPAELLFNSTGPILGTHTGPGALALAGYSE